MAEEKNRIVNPSFKAQLRECLSIMHLYARLSWVSVTVFNNFYISYLEVEKQFGSFACWVVEENLCSL